MIEIRKVMPEELSQLRQVAIDSYEETFGLHNTRENMIVFLEETYHIDRLQKELHEPGSITWLAWEKQTPVGYARMRNNQEVNDVLGDSSIELQRLYVLSSHKRKKIGSLLIQQSLFHASDLNCEWIWLGVWERNFNAQAFYASWGFEKFGEHIFQMGDDPQIDILMRKKLL